MSTPDPAAIGAACLCLHLRRAARAVARRYDAAFRPQRITSGQFSLMMMLAAERRWSMRALAGALGMDRTSLTAALKPLERRGLVASRPAAADRRVRELALTVAGRALLADALPAWQAVQARAEALLDGGEPARLRAALVRLS